MPVSMQYLSNVRILQAPAAYDDYATSLRVLGSNDGNNFTVLAANVVGTRGWVDIALPGTSPYRHCKVIALSVTNSGTWQVQTIQGFPLDNLRADEIMVPNPTCGEFRSDVGAPFNTVTGNFWHTFTDLAVPGRGVPLHFSRTYSSLAAPISTTLGYGWTHNYNMHIDQVDGKYVVNQENGGVVRFNSDFTHAPSVLAVLIRNGDNTYVFTRTHGLARFYFTSAGKLSQIVDRNGYTTTLAYNGNGLLETVTDPANRQFSVSMERRTNRHTTKTMRVACLSIPLTLISMSL